MGSYNQARPRRRGYGASNVKAFTHPLLEGDYATLIILATSNATSGYLATSITLPNPGSAKSTCSFVGQVRW